MEHMSDEDKGRVLIQVVHFIDIVEDRSGLKFDEVVSILRWARDRKTFHEQLVTSGVFTAIGIIITGILYAIWKGINGFHIDPP